MRVIYLWAAILAVLDAPAMAATPDATWDDRDAETFLESPATVEKFRESLMVPAQIRLSTHHDSILGANVLTPPLLEKPFSYTTPSSLPLANAVIRIDRRHSDVL
jgi:hypothetical protein